MKILHTLTAAGFLIVAPLLALAQNEATITEAPHISGGIGTEGMAEIAAQQASYNFKALFVRDPSGEYLALVNIKIADAKGNILLETATDGPVLLAQLKPGKYTITATTSSDAKSVTKKITVTKKLTETTFRFPPEVTGN